VSTTRAERSGSRAQRTLRETIMMRSGLAAWCAAVATTLPAIAFAQSTEAPPGTASFGSSVTTSASSAEPASIATSGANTGEDDLIRQRELQHRIDELRGDLDRSRVHLELLGERVLDEAIGGARVAIRHENAMGPLYRLERVIVTLDGVRLGGRVDAARLYDGALAPGDHTMTIDLAYRGQGIGPFRYLDGYEFHVRSTQSFTVRPGRGVDMRIVGYEQGNATTAVEQRPAVRVLTRDVPLRDLAE
jgi:hypothetical protein